MAGGEVKGQSEEVKLVLKVWDDFCRLMGAEFVAVLDYYVGARLGMPVREAVVCCPERLKEEICNVYCPAFWDMLLKIILRTAKKNGVSLRLVLDWFNEV